LLRSSARVTSIAGEGYLDRGYVFTRLNGDPMAPDWLSRYFRQLNDASGLPPIHRLTPTASPARKVLFQDLASRSQRKCVQEDDGSRILVGGEPLLGK
jgi:hypothetical protein